MEDRKSETQKFIIELKREWRTLWEDRFDDRVRAEGIANQDYPRLHVERGLVITATRDFKSPDFVEILQSHNVIPNPSVGGWGKFIRDSISKKKLSVKRGRSVPFEPERVGEQQRRKGGRGWLHLSAR